MTLATVIAAIQDTVGAVTGIRAAPDYAPDNIGVYPTAIAVPSSGTFDGLTPEDMIGLHNIIVYIFVAPFVDLPKALEAAIPYGELVAKALFEDTSIDGSAETFEGLSYVFGEIIWGSSPQGTGMSHLGWTITINNVKIRTTL
jgi:hypothetical protein